MSHLKIFCYQVNEKKIVLIKTIPMSQNLKQVLNFQ